MFFHISIAVLMILPIMTWVGVESLYSEGNEEPTDQSRADQLNELNTFIKEYLVSTNQELKIYKKIEDKPSELQQKIDTMAIILKLVEQSWLHSMKPDEQYYTLEMGKNIKEVEQDIRELVIGLNRITPIANAIILYTDREVLQQLEHQIKMIKDIIIDLNKNIARRKEAANFQRAEYLQKSKKKFVKELENTDMRLRQEKLVREMLLQSYVLDFNVKQGDRSNTFKIRHSHEDKVKVFPMPPLDTLTVLEEINNSFK